MPDDVMDRLAEADPARDPGRPAVALDLALLARAQARPRPRAWTRPAAVALATAALGAAALVIATGGDPHGTPDARAAVLRAAQALPDARSGVIVRDHRTVSDAPDHQLLAHTHEQLRYSAHAVEGTGVGTFRRESDGRLVTNPADAFRIVDGTLYVNLDGSGRWQARLDAPTSGAGSPEAVAAHARRGADREAATTLIQALGDVRRTDATTYAGTITAAALTAAYGDRDPFTIEGLTAHADQLIGGTIGVALTVGADGTLDTITFTERTPWTHPTLASATTTLTIDYRGLGTPQEIPVPEVKAQP